MRDCGMHANLDAELDRFRSLDHVRQCEELLCDFPSPKQTAARESSCPVNYWCCERPIFWWGIGAKLHQTEQKAGLGQMCYSLFIHHAAERAKQSPASGTQTRSEHTGCAKLHGVLQLSRCLSAQNDQVS